MRMKNPTPTARLAPITSGILPLILLLLAVLSTPRQSEESTNACLWDSDTLRQEADGLPGIAEIITGRFDRFEPEYFEHRLARVTAQIQAGEGTFADYDDAGVACDRLNRNDEAIEWMAKKLTEIEASEAAGESDPEFLADARYKYLANLGTFHIHRWLRAGADREDMPDVQRSRDLIAAAIELNPDAHFGRERYQHMAIEWLLNPPEGEGRRFGPPTILRKETRDMDLSPEVQRRATEGPAAGQLTSTTEGLAGLIVLGNAWESLDIFLALSESLFNSQDRAVAFLARLRAEELIDEGHKTLHPTASIDTSRYGWYESATRHEQAIRDWYPAARAEAEAWRAARNAYVMERLGEGQHPDTHPEFWSDWESSSNPPAMPNGVLGLTGRRLMRATAFTVIGFMLIGLIVGGGVYRRVRALRAKRIA